MTQQASTSSGQRTWGQRVDRVVLGRRRPASAGTPPWQHLAMYMALLGRVIMGRDLWLTVRWALLAGALLVAGAVVVGLVQWVVLGVTR